MPAAMHAPPSLHAENDAASQADRVAAETLIRTTVQSVGNGSVPQDLDELVRRNAGRVTREDLRSGRLGSTILGDIINSVEQAKGNTAINWSAATPQQMKAYLTAHGLDPAAYKRMMGMRGGGADKDGDSARSSSSGNRFAEIDKALIQARDVALAHNMPWVANNPELLRLGPAAVQALADVHLKQESYQRFKDGGLSPTTIVAGAKWAKRTGKDINEASEAFSHTQSQLTPEQQKFNSQAVAEYFKSVAKASPGQAGQPAVEAAGKVFNGKMDRLKKENPNAVPAVENQQKALGTQLKKEHKAEKKADAATVKAGAKEAEAGNLLASLNADKPAAVPAKPHTGSDQKKPGETVKPNTKEAKVVPKKTLNPTA
jgi:hypothetical protein